MGKAKPEGTIRQEKSGSYYVSITKQGRRKATRVATYDLAVKKLQEFTDLLEKEIYAQNRALNPDATLKVVVDAFIFWKKENTSQKVRMSSATRIEQTIANHIYKYNNGELVNKPFLQITSDDIQATITRAQNESPSQLAYEKAKANRERVKAERIAAGKPPQQYKHALKKPKKDDHYSYSQIQKVYEAWSMIYDFAETQLDLLTDSPMKKVTRVRKNNVKSKSKKLYILTEDEISKLRKELTKISTDPMFKGQPSYRYGTLIALDASIGLRAGELCGIKKSDIDLIGKTLKVKQQVVVREATEDERKHHKGMVSTKGKVKVLEDLKTTNSIRTVPLTDLAIEYIKVLMMQFPHSEMLVYGEKNGGEMELVASSRLNKMLDKACRNAGVTHIGMHGLRDYFASTLFDEEIDLELISEFLGHVSPAVTWKYYVTSLKKRRDKANEKINSSGRL